MRLNPKPGYLVCKEYKPEKDKKIGTFTLPNEEDPEKASEFGEILEVGAIPLVDQLHIEKLCSSNPKLDAGEVIKQQFGYEKGQKIAFKKYNYFTHRIGMKQYAIVHMENVLYEIVETPDERQ